MKPYIKITFTAVLLLIFVFVSACAMQETAPARPEYQSGTPASPGTTVSNSPEGSPAPLPTASVEAFSPELKAVMEISSLLKDGNIKQSGDIEKENYSGDIVLCFEGDIFRYEVAKGSGKITSIDRTPTGEIAEDGNEDIGSLQAKAEEWVAVLFPEIDTGDMALRTAENSNAPRTAFVWEASPEDAEMDRSVAVVLDHGGNLRLIDVIYAD
jgi:hypothetical protein